jgi:DNA-binding SARP family transcriptional activator
VSIADEVSELDCRVLGPLQILVGNRKVKIPPGKHGVLLALLLVRVGELVPTDEVIDRLWSDDLPNRPRAALQTRITRVRKLLDEGSSGLGQAVRSESGGYQLDLDPMRVDLTRFRRLADTGPACTAAQEAERLNQALGLVHGRILSDVRCPSLEADIIPGLEEELLLARERRC